MDKHLDQIAASRPAFVKPFNGVSSVEAARQKRPANYKIQNISDAFAIVEIYDEIGGWGVWASELVPLLRQIDGAGRTIEFRINSGGGDVFEGISIANAIKFMDAKTVAIVYGLAASIASVITVACDEVRMPSNAMMMIHRPHMILWGEAEDLRKGAALLDTIEQQLINTYADRATASLEQIAEMVAAETWMTAADAVALGFADVLIEDIRMAASASLSIEAKAAPAEALALLAGPTSPEQETTVSDATPTQEAPVVSDEQAPSAEAVAEVTDETPADGETPAAELDATSATTEPEASVEISADLTPATPAAAAEDGSPIQTTPEPQAPALSEEAISIRAACAVLDASDRADGFIAAGLTFEEVRKRLWDHRVAAAAQTEIDTQGTSLLAENPADQAQKPEPSKGPSDLKRSRAARAGRTI